MKGTTLSHYRIVDELGRGGMGIVYKAEDTKLDRTVAIKVLPSATLASEDDRARFYREAKAAAQLHHPHIASIFEIDEAVPSDAPHGTQPSPFIAMEYIDGETLSSRIAKGPLKIDEAVRLAKEVASALEAAHEKNIVHRDIKSANVMVTSKGGAKVLDFGLAKTAQSTMLTRMGSTLGTFAYMSPEQARGEEVDRRTDIWALGVVLYEMVSGRHPFPGDYEQAVVYSILNQDPEPLTAVRTGVPMELERIVGKLLAKDPSRRYQTLAGLNADLLGVDASASTLSSASRPPQSQVSGMTVTSIPDAPSAAQIAMSASRSNWLISTWAGIIVALALVAGLAIGKWVLGGSSDKGTLPIVRRVSMIFKGLSSIEGLGISPDGKYLVFMDVDSTGSSNVHVYSFENGDFAASYPNTGFRYSRFSPDGRWVAVSGIGAGVTTFLLPDGKPQVVSTQGEWAVWESNESLLIRLDSKLYRIPAAGGEPKLVAEPDSSLGLNRLWPSDVLVDRGFALIAGAGAGEFDRGIYALDLQSGDYKLVIDKAHAPTYLDSGHLMYVQGGGLVGQLVVRAFDLDTMTPKGLPATLDVDPLNWLSWTAGRDGTVAYTGDNVTGTDIQTWIDIDGNVTGTLALPDGRYRRMKFSPQGDRVAGSRMDDIWQYGDVWVFDLDGVRAPVRLTENPNVIASTWSADGSVVYYWESGQSGTMSYVRSVSSDGSTAARTIKVLDHANSDWLRAVPGDNGLLFSNRLSDDLFVLSLKDTSLVQITHTPAAVELSPSVSPDGRFVAFHDVDQPGSRIFVKEVDGSGQWEISDSRLTFRNPEWSADGRYLFFVTVNGEIFRHRISLQPTFVSIGQPELIARFPGSLPEIAVHPDGKRLLISSSLVLSGEEQGLHFIFNFMEEAKRIAPTR